ncbi:ABC transporter permease [Nigerium massiliense]|uniref:ABC transporter permease n=1 Tax=Nigerium massiliense TaxID=1522317 RepID=UPI00058BFF23|nr:ABC transporter permease [Nigerium massiliense]
MIRFLARRLGLALAILFLLSFLMYGLLNIAMDPLDDLRQSPALNREFLIETRIRQLKLDVPWPARWWDWLTGVLQGDFGEAWRTGQPVRSMLGGAIATSVQLVFAATVIALLLGVTIGVISALRQYTAFDYTITFIAFVLYALPIFWFAVLLKQFLAIGVNDYLNNPQVNWPAVLVLSVVSGLFWAGVLGGNAKRKVIVFVSAFAVSLAVLAYALLSGWVEHPGFGLIGTLVIGLAAAVAMAVIFAGINNRRALYAGLTTAVVGAVLYIPMQWFFYYVPMSDLIAVGLLIVAVLVALLIGWAFGGPDRAVSMRTAAVVAIFASVAIYTDRVLQGWQLYSNASVIGGRPIATIGAATPNLGGDYWITQLDKWTHLLLPTIALVVISFATYTRYERGAMLEVLNQDYIRTARAKGLSERVVIVRHALRNALMPLASIVPVDFISLIGGAVLTETIFGWSGMGRMFVQALSASEIDPVMIYIMITGGLAMIANLVADFLYAIIDPRIRVNA